MKIISFIIKRKVVRKIHVHLRLWDDFTRQRLPPSEKDGGKSNNLLYVPFDAGWPGYEV